MKQVLKLGLLAAIAALGLSASTITYTYAGVGTGTLGGNEFNNAAFTITAVGDTDNVAGTTILALVTDSASIDIAGQGTFSFTSALEAFLVPGDQLAGLAHGDGTGTDLIQVMKRRNQVRSCFCFPDSALSGSWASTNAKRKQ